LSCAEAAATGIGDQCRSIHLQQQGKIRRGVHPSAIDGNEFIARNQCRSSARTIQGDTPHNDTTVDISQGQTVIGPSQGYGIESRSNQSCRVLKGQGVRTVQPSVEIIGKAGINGFQQHR
jgi:hypothetical protein